MRIAVQCESPLLQRSLELFLEGHLASMKSCDAVLRDRKMPEGEPRSFFVSPDPEEADIVKPFTRAQLLMQLQSFLKGPQEPVPAAAVDTQAYETEETEKGFKDFSLLENRIDQLTREYQRNILKAVRAFYEE